MTSIKILAIAAAYRFRINPIDRFVEQPVYTLILDTMSDMLCLVASALCVGISSDQLYVDAYIQFRLDEGICLSKQTTRR